MRRLSLVLLLLALSWGCKKEMRVAAEAAPAADQATRSGAAPGGGAEADAGAAAPAALAAEPTPKATPRVAVRKLVKTVDLSLAVKATTTTAEAIQKLAVDLGGYVGAIDASRRDDLLYYHLTLRVPVEQLEAAVAAVKKLAARVDREQMKTEDVTDRYVDLDARVRTLQGTERELLALLAESRQKNREAKDIMEIYRELTGIRSQIEEIQAQLVNLDKLASFSTLNVDLAPTEAARPVAVPGWQPSETVRGSFRMLISFLRGLVDFLIYSVILLLPIGLLLFVVLKLLGRVLRRRLRKAPPAPPAAG